MIPVPDAQPVVVEPPPPLEVDEGAAGVLTSAVPMLGSLGSVALVATMASGASGQRSLLAAGAFLLGTLAFVLVQLDRQRVRRRRSRETARRGYLRHLADVRRRLVTAADAERRELVTRHPAPTALPRLATTRRQCDDPRLVVRYALGDRPASATPAAPEIPDGADPAAVDALRRLLAGHARVRGSPLTVDLQGMRHLVVRGDPDVARGLVRSLVAQAVAAQPPGRLSLALVADGARAAWDWLKWLPHLRHTDGHRLVVVDGGPAPTPRPGTTIVEVGPGGPGHDGVLRVSDDGRVVLERPGRPPVSGIADACDSSTAEALARRLCADPTGSRTGDGDPLGRILRAASGAGAPATWGRRGPLRVPLGTDEEGSVVHLDLEESARGGDGPHGLVVGATGSGKSELLRTLVCGLVADHPPDRLHLVLVDFKGGATFAGLATLPHVAASVTNLADDLVLVDRLQDALAGELVRRQEVLRAVGAASLHDLDRLRDRVTDLPSLPSLLVVVDEFAEMLIARPGFLEVFTAIGRVGRSLGIHLLLSSQRLDEGRLRGLETHLSYRVGLRTFSAAESRAVLGVADAAELPAVPGVGYLRTGPGEPRRFRASYVSGAGTPGTPDPAPTVRGFGLPTTEPDHGASASTDDDGPSLLDRLVARLADQAPRARPVWLPPLDAPDTLGDLIGPTATDAGLGLVATRARGRPLSLPLGAVDRPREQRRDPFVVDLAGAGGHLAVVGAPRSGRTTVLQSLVAGLSLTHTPREAQVLVLDLAGGGLAPLAGLPHVAAVATRGDPDVVRRVVARLAALLEEREAWWREHAVPDVATYRDLVRDGGGDGWGEVFLVVDGWGELRSDLDDLEPLLHRLASRGLTLGVHLVVAASRWGDLRAATRDLVGTRVELRLGDPLDSEVDRRTAATVPGGRPGRGLSASGHHLLTGLPRLDADRDPATAAAGLQDLVARVGAAWPGPPVAPVGRIPDRVHLAGVRTRAGGTPHLLLGEDDRGPVALDPAAEPHLLILGDRGTGRTTTLATLAAEVVRTRSPAEAQVVVVDPRRGLVGKVPDAHLLGHHTATTHVEPAMRELADHLHGRLPGPEVSPEQLRAGDWWRGAEVVVLVDDHELLGERSPLAPLLPLLPHASDIGLRVVLARRTSGAARALHEPDLRTLRELAAPVLLLPGPSDEGPLVGRVSPRPGPPGRGRLVTTDGRVSELQVAQP